MDSIAVGALAPAVRPAGIFKREGLPLRGFPVINVDMLKHNFEMITLNYYKLSYKRAALQWLAKKMVIWSIYLLNLVFLSKVFEF